MSGNGAQKQVNLQLGQDPRVYEADDLPVQSNMEGIIQGQNGCFAANWLVNGYYNIGFGSGPGSPLPGGAQGGVNAIFGFCVPDNKPNQTFPGAMTDDPEPSVGLVFPTARHCSQIACPTGAAGANTPIPRQGACNGPAGPLGIGNLGGTTTLGLNPGTCAITVGTTISGAAVTGADVHAIDTSSTPRSRRAHPPRPRRTARLTTSVRSHRATTPPARST